ncbi:hypothetical protein [Salinimicrobium xinjiangense]|uniref:hypothetical protein n=1 Tax=Salinimicrobium xinjiangense TaxID=438596 RepID=UPI00040B5611|nr:hypothetical protein [Salinimicrobium xinjiangense]
MKKIYLFLLGLFICTGTFAQDNIPEEIKVVDKSPVARGCDPNASNPELKDCFTRVVTEQILSKINASYLQKHNLAPGMYKVHTTFSIDEKGKVQDVNANFEKTKIAKHFAKAVKSIARVEPAYIDNKPVKIFYAIPIKFVVN